MLEAVLSQAGTLRKVLDCLSNLITDANIECTQEGMSLQSMDSSHVALVTLTLLEKGFDRYRCDGDRLLGVHVPTVAKGWRMASPTDKVTISNGDNDNDLIFHFDNTNEASQMTLTMRLLTLEQSSFQTPERQGEATITLPAKDFATLCQNCGNVGDTIAIYTDKNQIKFIAEGQLGQVEMIRRERDALKGETVGISIQASKDVNQSFSCKYLQFMSKCSAFADSATLCLQAGSPMEISFDITEPGDSVPVGSMRFFLAPKLEPESGVDPDFQDDL